MEPTQMGIKLTAEHGIVASMPHDFFGYFGCGFVPWGAGTLAGGLVWNALSSSATHYSGNPHALCSVLGFG